jgi:Flp pilus assembly protein TadD
MMKRIMNKDRFTKRVKTKWLLLIAFLSLFLTPYSLLYAQELTTEQEQQFTYYWYAAKHAIVEERYEDAYTLLEFCRMMKPNDGQTLSFLGILYSGTGQTELALETFRQAFEADPADQWYRYCNMLIKKPDRNSIKIFQAVLEKAHAAQKARGNGKTEEDLLLTMRKFYIDSEQWKKAMAIQDEIDARQGKTEDNAYYRAQLYRLSGNPKKAIRTVVDYLENDPTNSTMLHFHIGLLEQTKASNEALCTAYEKLLAVEPGNSMALNNYAYHLATHRGDLNKAERMSERTIREQPNNPVYLDTYGWILHLQGQNELALFYLQRAESCAEGDEEVLNEIRKHIKIIKK